MADFENDLRDALRAAVPSNLEAPTLAEGARRYARRARRARVGGAAAAVALVVALVGTSLSLFGGHRDTAPPARPRSTYTGPTLTGLTSLQCGQKASVTAPPARGAATLGDAMARLCPTTGGAGGGSASGWVLPSQPLTMERWIGYVRGALVADDPAAPCDVPRSDLGPSFTVLVQRLGGERYAYRSADLPCGGRLLLGRYLEALARERADADAAALTGYTVSCAVPDAQDADLPSGPTPGKDLRRPEATLCLYPVYPSTMGGPLVARPYHRIELTTAQVRVLNADLTKATLQKGQPRTCAESRWHLVLRMVKPGDHGPQGEMAEYWASCPQQLKLKDHQLTWRPGPAVETLLTSLLPSG